MKILITGGAGFIGSHLVERLHGLGHEVCVLDALDPQVHPDGRPESLSAEVEFHHCDVRDHAAVANAFQDVDRLVHLAAAVGVGQSMYEIERYTSVNAIGAAVVLEEATKARDHLTKVVVASSMSIYGEGLYGCPAERIDVERVDPRPADQLARREWDVRCPSCGAELEPRPTPETKPLAPASIYAVNKRDHEEMFLAWGRAYGVPVTPLRFFNVYGPRQSLSNPYTGVVAIFSSRLMNGRRPVIFEDGAQTRDFVHVRDAVAAVEAALEPGAADFAPINIGSGRAMSIREVAEVLARELQVDHAPQIENEFRAGDIRHCYADISRARELLHYEPQTSFDKGMAEYVHWLATQEARDGFDDARAALLDRGLAI